MSVNHADFDTALAVMSYSRKSLDYFARARRDFVARLTTNASSRILEVGCGTGATLALAKQSRKYGFTAGVELVNDVAEVAREHVDEVVVGNIENVELPWKEGDFDALILSEVLEHLIDPWATLRRLQSLLKPQATVLASSPNVAHWKIVRDLLKGNWILSDSGPMDRTHLRWFTPASYQQMFMDCGCQVVDVYPLRLPGWKARLLTYLSRKRVSHLFWSQICIEARSKGTSGT